MLQYMKFRPFWDTERLFKISVSLLSVSNLAEDLDLGFQTHTVYKYK